MSRGNRHTRGNMRHARAKAILCRAGSSPGAESGGLLPVSNSGFIGIHNIGNITGLIVFGLLSLLLLRLPQCRQKARARCRKTGWRVFYRIVCVFLAAVLLLAMVLAVCIFGAALRRPADEGTVVVLGAR